MALREALDYIAGMLQGGKHHTSSMNLRPPDNKQNIHGPLYIIILFLENARVFLK
jgi:hypothetical protein